jgi:hypothetical protein
MGDGMSELPGFFERLSLAFKVLGDPVLAARLKVDAPLTPTAQLTAAVDGAPVGGVTQKVETRTVEVEKIVERVVEKPVEKIVEKIVEKSNPETGALLLLTLLQRDGRLIDFLHEDVAGFPDADVGAAARVVHSGCKKAIAQYFTFAPVRTESEGASITVEKGFDPSQIRLAGNVSGEPPFKGKLAHQGWKATDVRLPERPPSIDARVVAPAEVEI